MDWVYFISSVVAFVIPGVGLLESSFSIVKLYNRIVKEEKPR